MQCTVRNMIILQTVVTSYLQQGDQSCRRQDTSGRTSTVTQNRTKNCNLQDQRLSIINNCDKKNVKQMKLTVKSLIWNETIIETLHPLDLHANNLDAT